MKLDAHDAGLALGGLFALLHAVWAVMVLVGLAQLYLDFIFNLHQLNNPFVVNPFNLVSAVILVVVTFVVGYLVGWVFAHLWNRLHKKI